MARALRPDDLYLLEQVTACDLHPDGVRAAYVVTGADKDADAYRSRIWLHDGKVSRPLTQGGSESGPRFSPDGRWLAYSAAQGAPPQLRVLPLDGGEPVVLTTLEDGVGEAAWLPDSSGLVFTAPVRPADQKGVSREDLAKRARYIDTTNYRFNGRGYTHDRRRHVFTVALPTGLAVSPPRQITDGNWDDVAPVASPDGSTVAFISGRHRNREFAGGNDVWVVPVSGGKPRKVTDGGSWQACHFLDNTRMLILSTSNGRGVSYLASWHLIDLSGSEPATPRRIGDGEVTCGPNPVVRDGALFTTAVRKGAGHIDRYDLASGRRTTVVKGDRNISAFAMAGDRTVFVATGSNTPAELHERVGSRERVLTSVTEPFTTTVRLAPMEEFVTIAADGSQVHGFVCRPPTGRGRRPGLLYVHGGPLAQYGWGYFDEFQMAAAAGYVVVGMNPRGSDGYGTKHAYAIRADYGNLDWVDIQAGADALAARRDVDPKRLGIGGGSYGGFMTAWATSRTSRFKAALVERAVINWTTMEATSDIGWFVTMETGSTTIDDVEQLRRQSPITYVSRVRTPTLVMHSEEDWRCPIEQGEQWFAALRRLGVTTEFVRFPGENHELTRSGRPSLRTHRLGLVHQWFDRFLK